MARSQFKVIKIEQTAERKKLHVIKVLVASKIHSIDVELGVNFVLDNKAISVASIGITKGSYNLLSRSFLLKDVNDLHNGFKSLAFRINNPTLIKDTMLSVTWEQFADRFAEWMRQYMLNKLNEMRKPLKELLK